MKAPKLVFTVGVEADKHVSCADNDRRISVVGATDLYPKQATFIHPLKHFDVVQGAVGAVKIENVKGI